MMDTFRTMTPQINTRLSRRNESSSQFEYGILPLFHPPRLIVTDKQHLLPSGFCVSLNTPLNVLTNLRNMNNYIIMCNNDYASKLRCAFSDLCCLLYLTFNVVNIFLGVFNV